MITNLKFLIIGIIALALTSCAKDELESPAAAEQTKIETPGDNEKRSREIRASFRNGAGALEINDDDDDETGGKPTRPANPTGQ